MQDYVTRPTLQERDSFGGCELFARSAEDTFGVRGCWNVQLPEPVQPVYRDDGEPELMHSAVHYKIGDTGLLIAIRNEKWQVASQLLSVVN